MIAWFLLDLAPDPSAIGAGELIVLVLVVLGLSALLIAGFVLLLIWRRRRKGVYPTSRVTNSRA